MTGKADAEKLDLVLSIVAEEDQLQETEQRFRTQPTDENRLQYAALQSTSTKEHEKRAALRHFNHILNRNNSNLRRDALYYLTTTSYMLKDYENSLRFCEELYR